MNHEFAKVKQILLLQRGMFGSNLETYDRYC